MDSFFELLQRDLHKCKLKEMGQQLPIEKKWPFTNLTEYFLESLLSAKMLQKIGEWKVTGIQKYS